MPTPLEIKRKENIARNLKLLADIKGQNNTENNARVEPIAPRNTKHKSTPQKRTSLPKKRVLPASDGEMEESPTKRARSKTPQFGLRRSSRNVGKPDPDYQAESQTQLPRLVARKKGVGHDRDPNRRSGKRTNDPYDWLQPLNWEHSADKTCDAVRHSATFRAFQLGLGGRAGMLTTCCCSRA